MLAAYSAVGTANFPRGSCKARSCTISPYTLEWDQGDGLCFVVQEKQCNDGDTSGCCENLRNSLRKIVLAATPQCRGSLRNVTLNGVKRGGGVYYNDYDGGESELHITNLALNSSTAPGSRFCIGITPPCDTRSAFCPGGVCRFSIYDPLTHKCCPTCAMNGEPAAIPPSPPPSIGPLVFENCECRCSVK